MANAHRNNALVTSCLRRPVDPHTRAPLASYERDEGPLNSEPTHPADNRGGYREDEDEDEVARGDAGDEEGGARASPGERVDPRRVLVSNEEYYGKLEELKKAHLRTMAELESMYRRKLRLRASDALRRQRGGGGSRRLRKSRSAAELQRGSGAAEEAEEGPPFSPKELIKNMWADFELSPRASPVPAHVRLPLDEERRGGGDTRQDRHLNTKIASDPPPLSGAKTKDLDVQPFSFLERERLKKEQRQQQPPPLPTPDEPEQAKPFKAKPVPRWVYASAACELRREQQLNRSIIEKQTRAREVPRSASAPPSALSKRLADSKKRNQRPRGFNGGVPDFEAAFKRFRKHLEESAEVKPATTCRPFRLSAARRIPAGARAGPEEPKEGGVAEVGRRDARRSGLRSPLSGSAELLPAKDTDATKKRQEAVRQALERRSRAEQEAARWTQRQKERERKLQKLVQKRASANDPRLPLDADKLQEFRKHERQRRREYQQELKEMEERVKGRPLLLEQVAQKNAKQAAQKRFADTLRRAHLSEDFLRGKAPRTPAHATRWRRGVALEDRTSRRSSLVTAGESWEAEDAAPSPTRYRKGFPDGRDREERGEASGDAGEDGAARHSGDHDGGAEEAERGKRQDGDDGEGLA